MNRMEIQKQVVKSVIKFILILLIFNCKVNLGQNINGKYCKKFNLEYTNYCLEFNNNEFKYEFSGDLGLMEYGKGSYFITKDSLILNFNKSEPVALNYHRLYSWSSIPKDSIYLKLKVKTIRSETFPYSLVLISSNNSEKRYRCNEKGELLLKLKKEDKEINVNIRNIGFSYSFNIHPLNNYEAKIFINENLVSPIIGNIWKYKILEFNEKHLNIRNKNGIISKWTNINHNTVYKK